MTPRDDGLSGQPKKRKMGKCRERPTLQDMAEKVSANSMWHTRPARCGAAEAAAREYGRHGMSRSVWWLCPPSVHLLYDVELRHHYAAIASVSQISEKISRHRLHNRQSSSFNPQPTLLQQFFASPSLINLLRTRTRIITLHNVNETGST